MLGNEFDIPLNPGPLQFYAGLPIHSWFLEKLEMSENLTIALLQCLTCNKGPEFLRILSCNVILTSMNRALTN